MKLFVDVGNSRLKWLLLAGNDSKEILYARKDSIPITDLQCPKKTIEETNYRRNKQKEFNDLNNIVPKQMEKSFTNSFEQTRETVSANYDDFKEDMKLKEYAVKNEILEKLIDNSKKYFNQQGVLIDWKEISKLKAFEQIYTLAMISPFSVSEKQKVLEIHNFIIKEALLLPNPNKIKSTQIINAANKDNKLNEIKKEFSRAFLRVFKFIALSSSISSCTSINTSMFLEIPACSSSFACWSLTEAIIIKMQSAFNARASIT